MVFKKVLAAAAVALAAASGPPPGISWEQLPQMVMVSFDGECAAQNVDGKATRFLNLFCTLRLLADAVSYRNMPYFQKLFVDAKRNNPNGCPARATMFVSHEYTNYVRTFFKLLFRSVQSFFSEKTNFSLLIALPYLPRVAPRPPAPTHLRPFPTG
jgi:hypothetical protein